MKLDYTVFSADRIMTTRTVDIDGEPTDVQAEGFSAQLTSPYGTIQLNLTKAQAAGHPFVVGETITVTFGGDD